MRRESLDTEDVDKNAVNPSTMFKRCLFAIGGDQRCHKVKNAQKISNSCSNPSCGNGAAGAKTGLFFKTSRMELGDGVKWTWTGRINVRTFIYHGMMY
jgi:hypothetical protein